MQSIARVDILWETALAWQYTLQFSATGSLAGPWGDTGSIAVTNGDGTGEKQRARNKASTPVAQTLVLA